MSDAKNDIDQAIENIITECRAFKLQTLLTPKDTVALIGKIVPDLPQIKRGMLRTGILPEDALVWYEAEIMSVVTRMLSNDTETHQVLHAVDTLQGIFEALQLAVWESQVPTGVNVAEDIEEISRAFLSPAKGDVLVVTRTTKYNRALQTYVSALRLAVPNLSLTSRLLSIAKALNTAVEEEGMLENAPMYAVKALQAAEELKARLIEDTAPGGRRRQRRLRRRRH